MSVYDWIESRVPGGHSSRFGRLLDVAYTEEYGAETTDQSSLNLVYLLGYQPTPKSFAVFGVSDERFHIAGGNEQLPEAIAATLPDVRTGWRMTRDRAERGRHGHARLRHRRRREHHRRPRDPDDPVRGAPHARLLEGRLRRPQADRRSRSSAPAATPSCSCSSRAATGTSGPWGLDRRLLHRHRLPEHLGRDPRRSPARPGSSSTTRGGNVAGAFAPSTPYSNADATAQVATYAQAFLQAARDRVPGDHRRSGTARRRCRRRSATRICTAPTRTGGSGSTPLSPATRARRRGTIHFAGEHCSQDFQGFMEGGAMEGRRAATEVLRQV